MKKKNLRKELGLIQTRVIDIETRLSNLQAIVDEISGKPASFMVGGAGIRGSAYTLKTDGTLVANAVTDATTEAE